MSSVSGAQAREACRRADFESGLDEFQLKERDMDNTTLLIIIILVLLIFGGGWYGRGRWF